MKHKKAILRGAFLLTAAGFLSRIMGFFYRIFLSRSIGADGLGLYQMIFPVFALALSFTSAGLNTAVSHQVSRKNALGDKKGVWEVFFTGAVLSLLLSGFAAGSLWRCAGVLAETFLKDVRCEELLKYLALSLPFASLHSIVTGCFIGRKKAGLPALSQLFEQAVRILSSLLLWQIFLKKELSPSPLIAVGGILASEVLTSLFTLLLLLLQSPVFPLPSPAVMKRNMERLSEIALPVSMNRCILGIFQSVEAVLIPLRLRLFGYTATEAYRHYGTLTGMALPLVLFPSAITGAVSLLLIPEISEADALNDRQAILRTARNTVSGCLYLGIFCTGGFFLFGKELGLFLFQSEEAGSYIRILGWICPFLYLGTTLASILNSLGKTTAVFFQNLLGILIRIFFVWFYIPRSGISGCLLGLLISQLVTALLSLRTLLKAVPEFELSTKDLLLPLLFLGWSLFFVMLADRILPVIISVPSPGSGTAPFLLFLRGGIFAASYTLPAFIRLENTFGFSFPARFRQK